MIPIWTLRKSCTVVMQWTAAWDLGHMASGVCDQKCPGLAVCMFALRILRHYVKDLVYFLFWEGASET